MNKIHGRRIIINGRFHNLRADSIVIELDPLIISKNPNFLEDWVHPYRDTNKVSPFLCFPTQQQSVIGFTVVLINHGRFINSILFSSSSSVDLSSLESVSWAIEDYPLLLLLLFLKLT